MTPLKSYIELLRRSPAVRIISVAVLVSIIIVLTAIIGRTANRKPVIERISPPIGSPGDIMVIHGENFGDSRGTSYAEIAGSRITSTGYLSWSDTSIKLVIPSNVQDGLVVVVTPSGKSNSGFFANEISIPVAVRSDPQITTPAVFALEPQEAVTGGIIRITGANFGGSRGVSQVFFTANREEASGEQGVIPASVFDWDYEMWSDTEIHVRVPDGSASGPVYVQTERGQSQGRRLTVLNSAGSKKYTGKLTYVVQVSADVVNNALNQDASITLYIPRPALSSFQPYAELNDCSPEPLIADDPYTIIQQRPLSRTVNNKQRFTQTFVVSTYAIESAVNGRRIRAPLDTKRTLVSTYTAPDKCVPSGDESIKALAQSVTGRETNPYEQARLLYVYMTENFKITEKTRTGNVSPLDLLRRKTGDAYDFAVIYTALCRQCGIPALPISGILVESDSSARAHWWTELYFEGFGWFPVDVALGSGLKYTSFKYIEDARDFYFGNLEGQHIAFSRGWHEIRPSVKNSKTVYRPRAYALQSIWEEASDSASSYSSLWNTPSIQGIY